MQSVFKSILANPCYDDQIRQIGEVERLKIELARSGVQAPIETLKRGMVLAEREEPTRDGQPKQYLKGNEFLLINPFKKSKKKKKDKKEAKRSKSVPKKEKGSKGAKSPKGKKAKKRVNSADSMM